MSTSVMCNNIKIAHRWALGQVRAMVKFKYLSKSVSTVMTSTLAMPPIRTGGTAMMMQPKAAMYEVSSALLADLLESTLWK